jgi:L-threonylcarbamoyladenylate synthase
MTLRHPFTLTTSDAVLDQVLSLLQQDRIIAFPTDSFYALGVMPMSHRAVERLLACKGRSDGKPILVLVAGADQVSTFAAEVPLVAARLMAAFWPGPLTIVVPAKADLPNALTAGTGTIGLRQPHHPAVLRLLRHVGPLTGTSANRSGRPPAQHAEGVWKDFGEELGVLLDGGNAPGGQSSTVVDTVGGVKLIREGPVSWDAIQRVLACA